MDSYLISYTEINSTTIQPSNSTPGYRSEKKKQNTNLRSYVHPVITVALFTIATIWKPPKALLTDDWMKKMCYIYTMEYYSAINRNDILPSAAAWMKLNNIILSEISQTDKDKYYAISLKCEI